MLKMEVALLRGRGCRCTAKNKGFHRGFLRVFIVSLRDNIFFVVFIKIFSQKPSQTTGMKGFW